MADTVYKVGCKNCDKCYIGETTRPLYVRQKEHQAEAEKANNTRTFTCQQKKDSNTTEYKSALVEHTATTQPYHRLGGCEIFGMCARLAHALYQGGHSHKEKSQQLEQTSR